jgi:hypothetical protein
MMNILSAQRCWKEDRGLLERREQTCDDVVETLVALYNEAFGGKERGRFRISTKLVRRIFGQRRVWPEQIEAVRRALYERGFLFIDLETYFAIVGQQTFAGYRRANETCINVAFGQSASRRALNSSAESFD